MGKVIFAKVGVGRSNRLARATSV